MAKSGIRASTHTCPGTLHSGARRQGNQALAAILFMYRELPGTTFENIQAVRAKGSTHIPAVLTVEETKRVLCRLRGVYHIIGYLLYGSGMRLGVKSPLDSLDIK